jgi:hypothetical protein
MEDDPITRYFQKQSIQEKNKKYHFLVYRLNHLLQTSQVIFKEKISHIIERKLEEPTEDIIKSKNLIAHQLYKTHIKQ